MAHNFLQLNSDKTEVIIRGNSKYRMSFAGSLGNLTSYVKPYAKKMGVIFLFWVSNSFCQLRIIAKLKACLSYHDLEMHLHWTLFISEFNLRSYWWLLKLLMGRPQLIWAILFTYAQHL